MNNNNDNANNNSAATEIRQVTIAGMLINVLLTIIKIAAGCIGNSQSVIADGIHSLSDCSTDIAVLIGLKYWNQPPDACHPYGHRRIETMISVFIGAVLAGAGIFIGFEAVDKFRSGNYVVPASITLVVALISVVVKEFLFHWTIRVANRHKSAAMRANAWHHRSDSLSSIPVAAAIALAMVDEKWALLDPVAALAVSAFIIQAAYRIVMPSLRELADTGADEDAAKNRAIVLQSKELYLFMPRSRFVGQLQVDLHIQVDAIFVRMDTTSRCAKPCSNNGLM
jgi:cation diffusion facilitator family transporter